MLLMLKSPGAIRRLGRTYAASDWLMYFGRGR